MNSTGVETSTGWDLRMERIGLLGYSRSQLCVSTLYVFKARFHPSWFTLMFRTQTRHDSVPWWHSIAPGDGPT